MQISKIQYMLYIPQWNECNYILYSTSELKIAISHPYQLQVHLPSDSPPSVLTDTVTLNRSEKVKLTLSSGEEKQEILYSSPVSAVRLDSAPQGDDENAMMWSHLRKHNRNWDSTELSSQK